MSRVLHSATLAVSLMLSAGSTKANVITDWDANGVTVTPPSAAGLREMAIMHVAMFDAVNSIARRYRPYMVQLTASETTSQEAAATAAAAAVLIGLHPAAAAQIHAASESALAAIPAGKAKADGLALGEAVAEKILSIRSKDGANAPDDYRPKTKPGVYVPTAVLMVGSTWPRMTPFALTNPSQFRAPPPILADRQRMGGQLQRDQRAWWQEQHQALDATDGNGALLVGVGTAKLSPDTPSASRGQADECGRERALHGTLFHCADGRLHRGVRLQVPI